MAASRLIAALTILAAVVSCGGGVNPQDFLQPQVSLRQVALRSLGVAGGTLDVQFAIANPNHVQVHGTRFQAAVDIQGSRFGEVLSTNPFNLTKQDTTLVALPLAFRWAELGTAARSIVDYGEVDYTVNGTLSVQTPANQPLDVPFTRNGSVAIVRALTGLP